MTSHRNLLLLAAAWCGLCASTAGAEMITALVVQDTYFYDRDGNRTLPRGTGDFIHTRVAQSTIPTEIVSGYIFEPDKLTGFSSSEVVSATFKQELAKNRFNVTDMGYDIIALEHEWVEDESTWNAQEQDCTALFGGLTCTENEIVDWFPDNGIDDDARVIFGDSYGTLDDIVTDYGDGVFGVGEIREWDVTAWVKAVADGTENAAFGVGLRNRIDANCEGCPEYEGKVRRSIITRFWSKDATHDPLFDTPVGEPAGLVVHNDDPWPPMVPHLVIELGNGGGFAGDLNLDGFVDQFDLDIVLEKWAQDVAAGDPADPTEDLKVDQFDLDVVLQDWAKGTPPGQLAAVPEPFSAWMIAIGGCLLVGRRTRR